MARGHSADFGTFGNSLQDFVMFAVVPSRSTHVCAASTARSFLRHGIGVTKAPADADAQAISDHEDGPRCSLEHGCW